MKKNIKAVVMTGPGKIEVQEFSAPKLEKGAMLVKILLSGVCGTDKHGYKGEALQYAGTEREINGPYPAVPGHENVGMVEEITPEAARQMEFSGRELKVGDRVIISPDILCGECYYCKNGFGYTWCSNIRSYGHLVSTEYPYLTGGWSEYMYVYPKSHVFKIDEDVSDEMAVLAEPMCVTYGLDVAKGHSSLPNEGFMGGDTVVVLGVGPLGMCHVMKARMLGAGKIVATDMSDFRLNMAKKFGADYVFNAGKSTAAEIAEYVKSITDGRGADVVVECTGMPKSLIEGIEMLRKGGTFIEVGSFVDKGEVPINPHRHVCSKNIRLIGMTNLAYVGYLPSLKMMKAWSKYFDFNKLVTHTYGLKDAEKAVLKSMELDSMKVAVKPN